MIDDVRQILLDIEEFKQKQFTGTEQIVISKVSTTAQTVTTVQQGTYAYGLLLIVTAAANDLDRDKVFIAHCQPEVRNSSGNLISTIWGLYPYAVTSDYSEVGDGPNVQRWAVYIASDGVATFTCRFHIFASTKNLTVGVSTR